MRNALMSFRMKFLILVLSGLLTFSLAYVAVFSQTPSSSSDSESPASTSAATPTAATIPSATPLAPDWIFPQLSEDPLPDDLSNIVTRVLPSVVSISVETTTLNSLNQPVILKSAGSGWILDSNGLIVTNNHVVGSSGDISVTLNDGRTFPAQQVATDPVTDLAVVKINATGLSAATLGDSGKLREGMMVIAIGNSLGEGLRVTAGWVSRLEASIPSADTSALSSTVLFDLIEISAPINPGNSGGPLLDMKGEVVGITNVKLIASDIENVGYAISMQTAMPVLQQLVTTGQVVRPYLGVRLQELSSVAASSLGLPVRKGALIGAVEPNSPASQAGLQANDVIVGINYTPINSSAEAIYTLFSSQIGDRISLTYYRGSTQSTVQVTLTSRPP